jgi:hypothetical protein
MKCEMCQVLIIQAEAQEADTIAQTGRTLCVGCAEEIARQDALESEGAA